MFCRTRSPVSTDRAVRFIVVEVVGVDQHEASPHGPRPSPSSTSRPARSRNASAQVQPRQPVPVGIAGEPRAQRVGPERHRALAAQRRRAVPRRRVRTRSIVRRAAGFGARAGGRGGRGSEASVPHGAVIARIGRRRGRGAGTGGRRSADRRSLSIRRRTIPEGSPMNRWTERRRRFRQVLEGDASASIPRRCTTRCRRASRPSSASRSGCSPGRSRRSPCWARRT